MQGPLRPIICQQNTECGYTRRTSGRRLLNSYFVDYTGSACGFTEGVRLLHM